MKTAIYDDDDGQYTGSSKVGVDGSSTWIALRDMLYRSNIDNNDDNNNDDDDDDDDYDGSIHVSIQYTTTTIYSWAEFLSYHYCKRKCINGSSD